MEECGPCPVFASFTLAFAFSTEEKARKNLSQGKKNLSQGKKNFSQEMCIGKTQVMKISRQPFPVQIMIDQKRLENAEYFNSLGSMINHESRCTREIISRIVVAKQNSAEHEKYYFQQQTGLKFKKETNEMLHLECSFVWC